MPAGGARGREQCQFTDGRSAERVAAGVVAELADVLGRPLTGSAMDQDAKTMASA